MVRGFFSTSNNINTNILIRSNIPFILNFYISKKDKPDLILSLKEKKIEELMLSLFEINKEIKSKKDLSKLLTIKTTKNKTLEGKKTLEEKLKVKNENPKQFNNFLNKLNKATSNYSNLFYSTLKSLYSITNNNNLYLEFNPYNKISKYSLENNSNGLKTFQEHNFQYKKKKGGNVPLDLVAYSQVTSLDYEEEMEIQRTIKMGNMGMKNYVDPEAMERHKNWSLFIFNQILSWFYYDFAI